MKITRNVILDLLPLYLADEASEDTRVLVEGYLETDPDLASIAEQTAIELPGDIPTPHTQEDKMKAYLQAKRLAFWRTVIVATMISVFLMVALGAAILVTFRFFN